MIYKNVPKKFNPRFEVVSCYIEHNNKILLLYRHEQKSEGNKWGMPAGKIGSGENKLDAMVREIREETGQKVSQTQLEYLTKVYVKYPEYDYVYHMFRTKLDKEPQIRLSSHEHKNYQWILPKDALKIELVKDLDRCIKMFYETNN